MRVQVILALEYATTIHTIPVTLAVVLVQAAFVGKELCNGTGATGESRRGERVMIGSKLLTLLQEVQYQCTSS